MVMVFSMNIVVNFVMNSVVDLVICQWVVIGGLMMLVGSCLFILMMVVRYDRQLGISGIIYGEVNDIRLVSRYIFIVISSGFIVVILVNLVIVFLLEFDLMVFFWLFV